MGCSWRVALQIFSHCKSLQQPAFRSRSMLNSRCSAVFQLNAGPLSFTIIGAWEPLNFTEQGRDRRRRRIEMSTGVLRPVAYIKLTSPTFARRSPSCRWSHMKVRSPRRQRTAFVLLRDDRAVARRQLTRRSVRRDCVLACSSVLYRGPKSA
jgi:hypothetical protein